MSIESKTITVGLIGNPNCGKTKIFNRMAKAHADVGNYPRVTVEVEKKQFQHQGWTITLVDLPGVYALTSQSQEERASRDFLYSGQVDLLINVLDAGNLERALFLTTQLLEMGKPTLFVLNMIDEARRKGLSFKLNDLSSMLNGPVVETDANRGEGIPALLDAVVAQAAKMEKDVRPLRITYDSHLEMAVDKIKGLIRDLHPDEMNDAQCRWLAIKLLEGDDELIRQESDHEHLQEMVRRMRYDLSRHHGDSCEMMFANGRFGFIHGLVSEAVSQSIDFDTRRDMTRLLDALFLHRSLGIPLFFGMMWLMFETTFSLGELPAGWIESGVSLISGWVGGMMPDGLLRDLMLEGVITGMGAVIVFLPYILILFFFIAFFSETGYLARSSFLLDRAMHVFGLHGKAFIPLVMGFGCNVPAVMATRTIESPQSRLIAILINPFMSCAQRLPAFILIAGAFFAESSGLAIFLIYMTSIGVAMGASVILSRFVIRGGGESFVMELPPYRLPTMGAVLYHMWDKAYDFVRMVGGVIVVGSVIIWFLQAFPQNVQLSQDYNALIAKVEQSQSLTPKQIRHELTELKRTKKQEEMEKSYLGQTGMAVSPIFAPLGFDWKDTVAIISGFFAKEVVVASYAVLYNEDDSEETGSEGLRQALSKAMSPVTAAALMVFLLLYSPCLSTFAAIKREASWGWAGFSLVFSLAMGWSLAYLVVVVGTLLT
ncbi:MAG: ferrous iron transport protein B [Magnetococcales bacterium]|nr:ferrous iron transport protein B [Magnetococcales bacterium]